MNYPSRSSILWRRLDTPGHDACRLITHARGWEMDGTAVFLHERRPVQLTYDLNGDLEWRTHHATVQGFIGEDAVDVTVARRADGTWTLNGKNVIGLESCVHLDLAFTPATNLQQLRRLAVGDSQTADLRVAWLDLPCDELQPLSQRYTRTSATAYWYEAPSVGYAATLEITEAGFIRRYPGLWESEG